MLATVLAGLVLLVSRATAPAPEPLASDGAAPSVRRLKLSSDLPPSAAGPAYSNLTFDAASAVAQERGCWLLVRVGAEWCAPCKQLDATTMRNPAVLAWIHANAVAIAKDVGHQPLAAPGSGGTSIPLMLLYRDGEERDRMAGYRSADQMLEWFELVTQGQTLADGMQARLVEQSGQQGESGRPRTAEAVRQLDELADQLQRTAQYDQALDIRLWLWEEALDIDVAFVGVRQSFWVLDMQELATVHAPAFIVFDGLRRSLEGDVLAGRADDRMTRDWLALCTVVGEEERLLDWYEQVRDDQGQVPLQDLEAAIFEKLWAAGRYAEAGRLVRDPAEVIAPLVEMHRRFNQADQHVSTQLANLHAALLAAGRGDEGRRVGHALVAEVDSEACRAVLIRTALAAEVASGMHARWLMEAEAMAAGSLASDADSTQPAGRRQGPNLGRLRQRLERAGVSVPVASSR